MRGGMWLKFYRVNTKLIRITVSTPTGEKHRFYQLLGVIIDVER